MEGNPSTFCFKNNIFIACRKIERLLYFNIPLHDSYKRMFIGDIIQQPCNDHVKIFFYPDQLFLQFFLVS